MSQLGRVIAIAGTLAAPPGKRKPGDRSGGRRSARALAAAGRPDQRDPQAPATVRPRTRSEGTTRERWPRASFAGMRVASIARRLPAIVHSFTGKARRPFSTQCPAAPRE